MSASMSSTQVWDASLPSGGGFLGEARLTKQDLNDGVPVDGTQDFTLTLGPKESVPMKINRLSQGFLRLTCQVIDLREIYCFTYRRHRSLRGGKRCATCVVNPTPFRIQYRRWRESHRSLLHRRLSPIRIKSTAFANTCQYSGLDEPRPSCLRRAGGAPEADGGLSVQPS